MAELREEESGMCPIRRSSSTWPRETCTDRGAALVVALLAMLVMMAMGLMLVLNTTTEVLIADRYRTSVEAFYAADGMAERAADDLARGLPMSSFVDGPPG